MASVRMVTDLPCTVPAAVITTLLEAAGVVATGAGVVAAGAGGVGVVPPEPVEPPQAATSIASKRSMLMGIARLRFFMAYVFLLMGQ